MRCVADILGALCIFVYYGHTYKAPYDAMPLLHVSLLVGLKVINHQTYSLLT